MSGPAAGHDEFSPSTASMAKVQFLKDGKKLAQGDYFNQLIAVVFKGPCVNLISSYKNRNIVFHVSRI